MGEMKPRLVWVAEYDDDSDYLSVMERLDTHGQYEGVTICRLHGEASADLIAEAGTVFHNTGLSPVQLVEMVKELKAASKHCEDLLTSHEINRVNGEELADTALAMLRAALAKCEGVKP